MPFYKKKNGYSRSLAQQELEGETLQLTGVLVEEQYEYQKTGEVSKYGNEIVKPTDNIQAYHIWVATANHNPFKIKFLPENKPNLDGFAIGDKVELEGLEAFENQKHQVYFRATGIKKGK